MLNTNSPLNEIFTVERYNSLIHKYNLNLSTTYEQTEQKFKHLLYPQLHQVKALKEQEETAQKHLQNEVMQMRQTLLLKKELLTYIAVKNYANQYIGTTDYYKAYRGREQKVGGLQGKQHCKTYVNILIFAESEKLYIYTIRTTDKAMQTKPMLLLQIHIDKGLADIHFRLKAAIEKSIISVEGVEGVYFLGETSKMLNETDKRLYTAMLSPMEVHYNYKLSLPSMLKALQSLPTQVRNYLPTTLKEGILQGQISIRSYYAPQSYAPSNSKNEYLKRYNAKPDTFESILSQFMGEAVGEKERLELLEQKLEISNKEIAILSNQCSDMTYLQNYLTTYYEEMEKADLNGRGDGDKKNVKKAATSEVSETALKTTCIMFISQTHASTFYINLLLPNGHTNLEDFHQSFLNRPIRQSTVLIQRNSLNGRLINGRLFAMKQITNTTNPTLTNALFSSYLQFEYDLSTYLLQHGIKTLYISKTNRAFLKSYLTSIGTLQNLQKYAMIHKSRSFTLGEFDANLKKFDVNVKLL